MTKTTWVVQNTGTIATGLANRLDEKYSNEIIEMAVKLAIGIADLLVEKGFLTIT